jgi:opine dehydrogenase
MNTLPKKAVVLGTGAGSLSIAAELELLGTKVTLADFPTFAANIKAVEKAGGVEIILNDTRPQLVPVHGVSLDPAAVAKDAELIIISVPCFGHEPFAKALAPVLKDDQILIWAGEGGGAFTTISELRKINRKPNVIVAETNSLPYGPARIQAPGVVKTKRKIGGTFIASIPTESTQKVYEVASQIWPYIKPATNVWETLLVNFNAIDHVATFVTNLGQVENRRDVMRFWGEGLSPAVAKVVAGVDNELFSLQRALGIQVKKQYKDYLAEQGMVDKVYPTAYETMTKSTLMAGEFQCGPDAMKNRYITEDVPYSLVLASSIGDELGVSTAVIDSLITIVSTAADIDYWTEGRTLETWGLKGAGRDGLNRAVDQGWW